LTKSRTSLVWIAGPLSGLIMQPIVGVIADRSRSKWGRRRPFMIGGSFVVAACLLLLGWTSELVGVFVHDAETVGAGRFVPRDPVVVSDLELTILCVGIIEKARHHRRGCFEYLRSRFCHQCRYVLSSCRCRRMLTGPCSPSMLSQFDRRHTTNSSAASRVRMG
jgi:MFS family permease